MYAKADIEVFRSSSILLDYLAFCKIFCDWSSCLDFEGLVKLFMKNINKTNCEKVSNLTFSVDTLLHVCFMNYNRDFNCS